MKRIILLGLTTTPKSDWRAKVEVINKYGVKVFNTHIDRDYERYLKMRNLKDKLYIENCERVDEDFEKAVKKSAGICFDVAHFHDIGLKIGLYPHLPALMEKYKVGCCHVSAIRDGVFYKWVNPLTKKEYQLCDYHYLEDLSEVDYVVNYLKYLPKYVSIELENSFAEQLRAKEYLEKIINNIA